MIFELSVFANKRHIYMLLLLLLIYIILFYFKEQKFPFFFYLIIIVHHTQKQCLVLKVYILGFVQIASKNLILYMQILYRWALEKAKKQTNMRPDFFFYLIQTTFEGVWNAILIIFWQICLDALLLFWITLNTTHNNNIKTGDGSAGCVHTVFKQRQLIQVVHQY